MPSDLPLPPQLPSLMMGAHNPVPAPPSRIEPQLPQQLSPIAPVLPEATPIPIPTHKPSSFSEDMFESLKKVLYVWQEQLARIFLPKPKRKIQTAALQTPPAALVAQYVPNPDTQELLARRQRVADQRLSQIQAQAEEQDLQMRSQSLLNTAVKMARPNQDGLALCQEKLRALLESSCATLTECARMLGFRAEDKVSAIQQWQACFESLRTACQENPETGPITHATAHYEALCTLPTKPKGTTLYYSGAFGKKQCLIQALLTKGLPLAGHAAAPLPPFLLDSIQNDALSDPEAVLSYGFDTILEYLFQHDAGPTLTRQFEETLDFLKPFLPNINRHYELTDFLKSKIPTWLVEKDPDPIQQGLIGVLLDLFEDSAMRDRCVDLLEKGSELALAEDLKTVIAQCKQALMKQALAQLPLPAIDALNQEMEQQLIFYLKEFAGADIAQGFSAQLLSHGTYWFEWSYDATTAYSLSIYASGSALADKQYPRQEEQPVWPIKMHGIVLTPDMLKILKALSTTTAVANRWKKPGNSLLKTREELFGEHGLAAQFEGMGAQFEKNNAALEKDAMLLSQMEMVSTYFQPDKSPERVRYEALRKQLLNTCASLGHVSAPGLPPHLSLPAGEEGKTLLKLLQSATTATLQAAQRAKANDQEIQELNAFEKQLELELKKIAVAEAAHTSRLKSEEALGGLIDQVLPFLCQEAGQLHLLIEYKELLTFIFGQAAQPFIEALCKRAEQFQAQVDRASHLPQVQLSPQAAPVDANVQPSMHRKRGWIGQTLNHPSVRICWFIYRTLHRLKGLTSLGWIGFLPPKLAAISPKFLGLKNFASHGWAGLIPELIGPVSRAVLPQATQDALYRMYTYLYGQAMMLLRLIVFKVLFPSLTYTQFIQDLNAALSRLVNDAQAITPTYYPAVLLPPPVKAEILDHLADLSPELRAERQDAPAAQLLHPEINGVTYTRLTTQTSKKLLELLSGQFSWITALKSYDTECYTYGYMQRPADGSRATILVTHSKHDQEEQLFFVLEGQNQSYQLMGMLDMPSRQIVHPAPRSQAESFFNSHCLAWMSFCPLSCMQLMVNRQTGLLSHCHMALFNLEFSLKETPDGWQGENSRHFPGFWIAKKQSVPFGLILENAQGKKQLLLPGNTLLHQTLYAQLDPLFGVLGNFVQRQEILHQEGSFYCYRSEKTPYLKDAWASDEPNAMVHLLLLYCSYRQKEQMLQAGRALLRMSLPQSMEIELLPLQFYPDPDIQQLYAELLAHLETSFIAKPAKETPGVIAQYLPQEIIQLVSCINAYRLLASETSSELEDPIFHNLAKRYKRLIHTNEAVLMHFLRYPCVKTLLNTDWLALHILPTAVKDRIARLESALGNRPGTAQRAIDVTYTWYNLPHAKMLTHPLASQMVLSQGIFNYVYSPMRHLVRREWVGKIIRSLPGLTGKQADVPLDMLSGLLISKMQPLEDAYLTPDLSRDTLIAHFFAYLAISEGKLGSDKQKELARQARALYFFTEGIEKQLLETLLTVSRHTYQYALFERLQKPKKPLKTQTGQLSNAEKHQHQLEHMYRMKLQTAVSFRQRQPLCQSVQAVSTYSLALMGTFYMLTVGSEYAFKATSETVTPYVAESAHMLIPASFLLSIASLIQNTSEYAAVKDATVKGARALANTAHLSVPASLKKRLRAPPKMRSVARHTAQLSRAALTLFTIHCVNAYTSYAAQPVVALLYGNTTLLNAANTSLTSESPQEPSIDMSVSTIMMIMIGLIPTFKRLYDMTTFLYVAYNSSLKQQPPPVLLLQDRTPCISLECRQALQAEEARFRSDLGDHFDACFETHQIAQEPVTMDFVQSEKIKQALAIYARSPQACVRTVFSLRSPAALDDLRTYIDEELAKVDYTHTRALNDLFFALGIAKEDQGMCMQALYHFFAVQNTHALKAYKIDLYEQNKLQKILPTLFLQETHKQQLQKIAKTLQALKSLDPVIHAAEWETTCDELIIQIRAQREYDMSTLDPKHLAFFLAFESRTNTLLWKKQIQTMLTVLNARGASVAYELLMSLGKTFFAVPTTALLHADGSRAVFIVLPPDVYEPQTRAISEQIFLLAGRYLTPLTIDRNFPLTEEHLDGLLRLIENTKRGKGVISTRSRDLRALELLFFTQLETFEQRTFLAPWETRQLEQLKNILLFILEKSAFVCDELHALFDDPPLNFPVGPKVKLERYEAQSVRKTVGALLKGPLGKILSKYTHLNADPDAKEIFEQEKLRVARYVVAKSVCGYIPPHNRQSVIEYLLDAKKPSLDFLPPDVLSAIDAARGVLLSLFPLLFTRIMGSHFGRSKKHPRLREVLPYTGHDNPAESRRFTTGLEALTKTLVDTWHHGLSLQDFKDLIEVCYMRSAKWSKDNKLPIARAPEAKAFAKLFAHGEETLESAYQKIHQNAALQALLNTLQPSVKLLLLYSRLTVEPTLAYQKAQVTGTAHNFIDMSALKIGGSGTLYNKDGYSLGMQRQLDATTEGAALSNIKRKCRGVISLRHDTPQEILQEVIETFFVSDIAAHALLDGGALLTGLSHRHIAEVLLNEVRKKRPNIEAVHFFTIDVESGEPVCMSLMYGKDEPIPKHTCSTLPENALTFFDEARCFAADVPQPKGGIGVWLVGAQQPLHHDEQTTHRLRGIKETVKFIGLKQEGERLPSAAQLAQKDLTDTQSLYMAVSKQVSRSIYSAGYQTITPEHVLDYGATQAQVDEKALNLKMSLSMLQAALRTPLKNALLKASSAGKLREHYKAGRSVFLQKTPQGASTLYGGAHVNISGETLFLARYTSAFKQIHEHPLLLDEEREKAIKDLEAVLAHVLSLSLPQEIPVRVNVEGTYILDGEFLEQGQEVEQNHDVEKEEENQMQRQLQQQKQVQLAKPLEPLNVPLASWSDACPLDSRQWQWSDELLKKTSSTLSRLKVNLNAVTKRLSAVIKKPKNVLEPAFTPPLFKVQTLLETAANRSLRPLSKVIDKRLWWSNNLLPQLLLSLRSSPAQMATGQQHPIVHLLIEVEQGLGGNPDRIVSVGCLHPSEADYWLKRLHTEQERERAGADGKLFMLYQLPVLRNLRTKASCDGAVLAYNRPSDWKPEESLDFQIIEVMVKFCNGDIYYTDEQRTLLKRWKQHSYEVVANPKALDQAFDAFYSMSKPRLGLEQVVTLKDILDPTDDDMSV